jgi:hypothetical protein
MMLGFMSQFVAKVRSGEKRHSLRAGKRWKAGMRADLYEKPRQSGMALIFRSEVLRAPDVEIWRPRYRPGRLYTPPLDIVIDGATLDPDEAEEFAQSDGFDDGPGLILPCLQQMAEFWIHVNKLAVDRPWEGQLVAWDYENRFWELPREKAA